MEWTLHARFAGEPAAWTYDGTTVLAAPDGTGWAPEPGDIGWTESGERGPRLTFSLVGDGPTFDLLVRQGDQSVTVSGLHITHKVFGWLESMDGACLLTGEPGHGTAQRMIILGLGPVREALAAGKSSIDGYDLDHVRIIAASHGLDLDIDNMKVVPADGDPNNSLVLAWNIPRSSPPESRLKIISMPGWMEGVALDRANVVGSPTIEFQNLWLDNVLARTREDGTHAIDAVGVTRRRTDFCVAVRTLRSDTPLPMGQAFGQCSRGQQDLADLELRNGGAIEHAHLLRGSERMIVMYETPSRKRKAIALTLNDDLAYEDLGVDPLPKWITAEVGGVEAATTSEAPVGSVASDGRISVSPGRVEAISLGVLVAAPRVVPVIVAGDAPSARLHWWLGRDDADEGTAYTLYVEATTSVDIIVE